VAAAVNPFPAQHHTGQSEDYFQIHSERDVLDVPDVVPENALPRLSIASEQSCVACYSWEDLQALSLFIRVTGGILDWVWAWSNQAHVSFKHIPEAGKLVYTRGPENASTGGQALSIWEQFSARVAGVYH
jgi:hypothetical protein